jgi:hypothetical protein
VKILIACEFSGIVRDCFIAKGHEAISCDLLPSESNGGGHIQGDVLDILYDTWDMIIAFPPCTDLAVSGAAHFEKKKANGSQQKSIDFFMKFTDVPCGKVCIENPIGIMSSIYRKPDQIIHPYYFGDSIPKKTCLWLKGLPKLQYALQDTLFYKNTAAEPEYLEYNSAKTKSGKSRYSVFGKLGKGCGHERSVFHKGISLAMAYQWG